MKKIFVYGMVIVPVVLLSVFFSCTGEVSADQAGAKNYVMIFQATEYNAKLAGAVDYFFNDVLKPEDNLALFSPQRPYNYSQKTRQAHPLKTLIERTKEVLKRDISVGGSNQRGIVENMAMLMMDIGRDFAEEATSGSSMFATTSAADLKKILLQYRQLLANLRSLRKLNEKLFLDFGKMFQQYQGEKHIFVFYEKEFRVVPDRNTMDVLRQNPDLRFEVNELFVEENKDQFMDGEKVGQALKAAGARLHLIYLKTQVKRRQYMEYNEFSGDVYNVFSKIAGLTGGTVTTTTKPEAALKKIMGGGK